MRRALFGLTLLGGLFLAATAWSQAERWLFYPFDARQVSPEQAGMPNVTETRLQSDGATLIVWTAPPRPGKPVILYFHGNASNLALRTGRFRRFLDRGYGLIAPAYRGSSGSTGIPSEEVLIADARLVHTHGNWPDWPANPGPTVIYGESLGTAVAIALLADEDTEHPAALILEAPFTSIKALAEIHYPALAPYADTLENKWPSLERARALTLPLFILHGTDDPLNRHAMGRAIHDAAPSPRKQFLSVKGAGHNDLWRSDTLPRLWRFIDTVN